MRRSLPRAASWAGPLLFSLAVLAALELILRFFDFRYAHYPVSMRYVQTLAHIGSDQTLRRKRFHIDYTLDRTLLWKPVATPGITNSLGFIGPEWNRQKSQGLLRLIALGDSCTVAGEDPYPAQLSEELGLGPRKQRWEVLNAGVGSWSSYQGLKLLETRLLEYKPDVVTIYFGWNDHWLAWAAPDKDLSGLLDRQWRLLRLIEPSRLAQGLLYAADSVKKGPRFSRRTPPRVAPQDYTSNLEAMVRLVRRAGGQAALLTAPTSLTAEHPMTLRLCQVTHNFFDPADLESVHEAYNQRVRDVARRTGAILVDLAAEFAREPRKERLFTDGIHLSREGHRRAAQIIAARLREARRVRVPRGA